MTELLKLSTRAMSEPDFGAEARRTATASARQGEDVDEQSAVRAIVALTPLGLSLRALSRWLADGGALARNGRPFAPMTLARLLLRRAPGVPQRRSAEHVRS
jgi:hypothetical protein